MEEKETWELLERLGAVRRGHFQDGDRHTDMITAAANLLADPSATQQLAHELVARLGEPKPDVVLVWAGMPSVLLGFLVGVALERPVVRLADDEGMVYASSELTRGQRAVLVGDLLTEREVRLARAFAENRGASLALVASLVDKYEAGEVVALAATRDHRFAATECPLCRLGQPLEKLAEQSETSVPNGQR